MTPERYEKFKRVLARRQPDLTLLAENVHKSHNISALLRTADAVGIHRIHAVSPGGEIPRHHLVSGGTRKWVGVQIHETIEQAVAALKASGHAILAAHVCKTAEDYREADYTQATAVLLGAELDGVTDKAAELADKHIAVPMEGQVASLNVAVAAALILYEARRQRENAGLYDSGPRLPDDEYQRVLFEWCYPEVAAKCRAAGLKYPRLSADGSLLGNPFVVEEA